MGVGTIVGTGVGVSSGVGVGVATTVGVAVAVGAGVDGVGGVGVASGAAVRAGPVKTRATVVAATSTSAAIPTIPRNLLILRAILRPRHPELTHSVSAIIFTTDRNSLTLRTIRLTPDKKSCAGPFVRSGSWDRSFWKHQPPQMNPRTIPSPLLHKYILRNHSWSWYAEKVPFAQVLSFAFAVDEGTRGRHHVSAGKTGHMRTWRGLQRWRAKAGRGSRSGVRS